MAEELTKIKTVKGWQNDYTTNLNLYCDFADIFGRLNSKLLTARGYTFQSEDPEIMTVFENLETKYRFQQKLEDMCYRLPKYSFVLFGFDKIKNKATKEWEYPIYLVSSSPSPYVTHHYDELIAADIHKNITNSNNVKYYMRERWTTDNVERTYYYGNDQVVTGSVMTKIPKEWQLPLTEKNVLGVLPFQDFTDRAFTTSAVDEKIKGIIRTFNLMFHKLEEELKSNRTFIIATLDAEGKKQYARDVADGKETPNLFIQNVEGYEIGGAGGNKMVEVIQGNPQVPNFMDGIERLLKVIFGLSEFNYSSFVEGATATEVNITNSSMNQTFEQKKGTFDGNMKIFLTKLFEAHGITDPKFVFYLNPTTAQSRREVITDALELIKAGVYSRAVALSKIDNIDLNKAETMIDQIDTKIEADGNEITPEGLTTADKQENTPQGKETVANAQITR